MKKLSAALLAVALLSPVSPSLTTPALALGGCGPNGHRNVWGYYVFGGQNQDWRLMRTGHPATRMPNGTLRCFR